MAQGRGVLTWQAEEHTTSALQHPQPRWLLCSSLDAGSRIWLITFMLPVDPWISSACEDQEGGGTTDADPAKWEEESQVCRHGKGQETSWTRVQPLAQRVHALFFRSLSIGWSQWFLANTQDFKPSLFYGFIHLQNPNTVMSKKKKLVYLQKHSPYIVFTLKLCVWLLGHNLNAIIFIDFTTIKWERCCKEEEIIKTSNKVK